ncbi:hypothetical protein DU976_17365 [Vibrio navarrensis]|nr:hypothetical protein [Vibrio navarrensis]
MDVLLTDVFQLAYAYYTIFKNVTNITLQRLPKSKFNEFYLLRKTVDRKENAGQGGKRSAQARVFLLGLLLHPN